MYASNGLDRRIVSLSEKDIENLIDNNQFTYKMESQTVKSLFTFRKCISNEGANMNNKLLFLVVSFVTGTQIAKAQVHVSRVNSVSSAIFAGAGYQYNIDTKKISNKSNFVKIDVNVLGRSALSQNIVSFSQKVIKPAAGVVDIYLHMKSPKIDVKVTRLRLQRSSIEPLVDNFISEGSELVDDGNDCYLRVVENIEDKIANAILPSAACGIPGVFAIPYKDSPELKFIPYPITNKTEVAAGKAGIVLREATNLKKQTLIWTGSEKISYTRIDDGELVADFKSLNNKEAFYSRNFVSNDRLGFGFPNTVLSMTYLFRDGHVGFYIPDFKNENQFRVERFELNSVSKTALTNGTVMEVSGWTLPGYLKYKDGEIQAESKRISPSDGMNYVIFDKNKAEGSILHLQLVSNHTSCRPTVNACLDDPSLKFIFIQNTDIKKREFLEAIFMPELEFDLPELKYSRTSMALSSERIDSNDYQGFYVFVAPTIDNPEAKFFSDNELRIDSSCNKQAVHEARARLLKAYPYRFNYNLPIAAEKDSFPGHKILFNCSPGQECDSKEYYTDRIDWGGSEISSGAVLILRWVVDWDENSPGKSFPVIKSCKLVESQL